MIFLFDLTQFGATALRRMQFAPRCGGIFAKVVQGRGRHVRRLPKWLFSG
jgi:hypothetical protein